MTDVISTEALAAPPHPTIRREDYRPPEWLVPKVSLDFDLSLTATRVEATLEVTRAGAHAEPLRLDVDGAWRDHLLVAMTVEEVTGSVTSALVQAGRASWA